MQIKLNSIENLRIKLDQFVPLIYVLTEDEHRAIVGIDKLTKEKTKYQTEVFVYKSTTGIIPYDNYIREIDLKVGEIDAKTAEINNALINIYKQNKKNKRQVFILTEADKHLEDDQVIRRIKDFVVQADNSDSNLKVIILMSSRLSLPGKLEKMVDVITYPYPNEDEIKEEITNWITKFNTYINDNDKKIDIRTDFEVVNALKGLIIPQIHQSITACLDITRRQCEKAQLDPIVLNQLKREAINKTSLLKFREPKVSFKDVGGLGRLKTWYNEMYGGWTNEGRAFGLPQLKGSLLIGLPGCVIGDTQIRIRKISNVGCHKIYGQKI
ncbi:MAG: hypothetical protein Q7R33_00750 [Nitrosarchaeum sp.]|nr:hypothetical protein [Nitrosarchaeum sp.]